MTCRDICFFVTCKTSSSAFLRISLVTTCLRRSLDLRGNALTDESVEVLHSFLQPNVEEASLISCSKHVYCRRFGQAFLKRYQLRIAFIDFGTDALNCTQVLLSLESGASRRLRGKVAWAALCGAAQRCPSATAKVAGSQGRQKMPQLLWPWQYLAIHSFV